MPLLARMLAAPLTVDVRPGAICSLGTLLADRRIATEGRVAVAVGPGQGDSIVAELEIERRRGVPGRRRQPRQCGVAGQAAAGRRLRGGGRHRRRPDHRRDQVRRAHGRASRWSPVATNLAHDGIASPVSSLEHESGKGSYGVAPPGRGRRGPGPGARARRTRWSRAGIGDVVSDLSAVARLGAGRGRHRRAGGRARGRHGPDGRAGRAEPAGRRRRPTSSSPCWPRR